MTTRKRRLKDARGRLLDDLPVTERRLQLTGLSTAVLEGGDGPPIVPLHGPGKSTVWWMRVVPDLVTDHRAIVPDLPGHGASEVPDDGLDADPVVAWLGELVERTCPAPPTLVWHLLGGAVAARFAIDHGDRLERLVLVDALGPGRFRPSARFAFGLVRFLVHPSDRAYHGFLDQCPVDRDGLIERMADDWEPFLADNLERSRTPSVKTAMRTLVKEVGGPTIPSAALARIAVSTALIWGRDDRAVRLGIAEDASARYDSLLHVIDDAGDDPKLERPGAFLDALHGILDDRSTAAGGTSAR